MIALKKHFTSTAKSKEKDKGEEANALQKQIADATIFIKKIEEGELETSFPNIEEKDVDPNSLPGALISMRNRLKSINESETQRKWVSEGLTLFAEILRKNQNNLSKVSDEIISALVKYIKANQGSLYLVNNETETLDLKACYAYDRKKFVNDSISFGDGMIGQVYLEKETLLLKDIPQDYIKITSGLGEATPRALIITPLKVNEEVMGVIELASFNQFEPYHIEFLEKLGESIASSVSAIQNSEKTQYLLNQSQQQTEEMRSQEEEMKQNMEELSATQEEMQRIMKEIQDKEAFTNGIIDASSDAIFVIDREYRLLQCNATFTSGNEKMGQRIEVGDVLLDTLNNEARPKIKANYDRALKGESFEITETLGKANLHLLSSYKPILNANGEIYACAVFAKDITELIEAKEQAERMLAESNEQSQMLKDQEEALVSNMKTLTSTQKEMEYVANNMREQLKLINATISTIEFDLEGNIKSANENFQKLMGYTEEELEGHHHKLLVTAEDANSAAYKKFWQNLAAGKSQEGIFKRIAKSGKEIWIKGIYSSVLDADGNPEKVIKFAYDITNEKEQEAEVRSKERFVTDLMNATTDNIFTVNREYELLLFNKAFQEVWEAQGLDVKAGMPIAEIFDEQESEAHFGLIDKALAGESIEIKIEKMIGGKTHYFNVIYSPIKNDKEEIIAAAVFAKNITELEEANIKQQQLFRESQEQNEEIRAQEEELRQNMEELSATQEEMQRIMNEVQKKEAFTSSLINASTDSIFVINKKYQLLQYNGTFEAGLKQAGVTVQVDQDVFELLSEDEKERNKKNYDRVFKGETFEITEHISVANAYYLSTYTPLFDLENKVYACAVYAKNITELVKAKEATEKLLAESQEQNEEIRAQEEELRQNMEELSATQEEMERIMRQVQDNEQFISDVMNASKDHIFTVDKDLNLINCNQTFRAVWESQGIIPEKGMPIAQFFDDKEREGHFELLHRALNGENLDQKIEKHIGEHTLYFNTVYSGIKNLEGETVAAAIFAKDITELELAHQKQQRLLVESQEQNEEIRAQEEELRQNMEELSATQEEMQRIMLEIQGNERYLQELMNVIPDPLFTMDHEGIIQMFNSPFEKMLAQHGNKVEKGTDFIALQHTNRQKKDIKNIIKKVLGDETVELTIKYETELGEVHICNYYCPIKDVEENVIGVAAYSQDITELVMARKAS